jgi:hypothetical protein
MVTRSAASDLYFRYGTMSLLVGVLSCSLGDFSDLQRGSGKHGVGNPSPSGGSTSLGGNTGGVRALGKGGDTGGLSASAQGGSVSSGGAPGATGGVLSVNTGVGGAAGSALGGQGGTGGTSWVSGPAGGGNSQDCTQILADSLADFSSTQGKNGWHYGYYAAVSGLKSVNFVEMSGFRALSTRILGWRAAAGRPLVRAAPTIAERLLVESRSRFNGLCGVGTVPSMVSYWYVGPHFSIRPRQLEPALTGRQAYL